MSDSSAPQIASNKYISGQLKLLMPLVKTNNYVKNNNLRYTKKPANSSFASRNTTSLPKLSIKSLEKPGIIRKPSMIIGQHPKKPYLNIRAPRNTFERPVSHSATSITSERTTTSLQPFVKSDSEAKSNIRQPLSYKNAISQMKTTREIKAKDRIRLNRFKKEKFIYSSSSKQLTLSNKYKAMPSPASYNSGNKFLHKLENSAPSNIIRMEEKKEGSNIPVVSHTERMKNNIQRLNLLSVHDNSKGPIKSILKRSIPAGSSISPITYTNVKANTLTNAISRRNSGYGY
jgi:hypothetical protein